MYGILIELGRTTVYSRPSELKERRFINRVGSDENGYWEINGR